MRGLTFYDVLQGMFSPRALVPFIVASLALGVISRQLQRRGDLQMKRPDKRKGLILLVSSREICQEALEWHAPSLQHCWLVHSAETKSAELAVELCNRLAQEGKDPRLILVQNVFDVSECQQRIDGIYDNLPKDLTPSEVILDFTGMPSVVSVAAALAALGHAAPLQYTPGVYNPQLKARMPLPPVEVVIVAPSPPAAAASGTPARPTDSGPTAQ